MFRKHELLPSQHMGRHVHVWRYGHYGPPVIAFPSASGMAHEWESNGMIDALADWLNEGRLKLYTVESNVSTVWTRKEVPPYDRIQHHHPYERWVMDELVPFIRHDCANDNIPIAVAGTSLSALYAANFALKFPETFCYALCMSGRYDARWLTAGFMNDDVYFNSPISYVPGIEGDYLESIRRHTHLAVVCGQGKWEDGNVEEAQHFAGLLHDKGIPHQLDLWGHDVTHQWPWWARQTRHHLASYLQSAN